MILPQPLRFDNSQMTNYARRGAYNCRMEVIYIDSLFFLNLGVDYLLCLASARICGLYLRRRRYVLAALLGAREEELVRAANGYERGCQLKFQLSRENYEYIRRWRDEKGHYNGSAGRFIKAVIEEYAAKPYCRREAIIFSTRIGMLRGIHSST